MEKTIPNCFHLDAIDKVFPDALFIHLVRDGRANVSSMIEGWNTFVKVGIDFSFPKEASVPYWSYAMPPGWQKTLYEPIEKICAWSWAEHNRYILEKLISDERFQSRYLKVYYEDFIQDPFFIVDQVSKFCGLEISDDCVDYLNSKPLSRTTVSQPKTDKWKQKNGEKIDKVSSEIWSMMKQLGYTTTKVRRLLEVPPQATKNDGNLKKSNTSNPACSQKQCIYNSHTLSLIAIPGLVRYAEKERKWIKMKCSSNLIQLIFGKNH